MSNALLVTVVDVKMKLGDNALNNERLTFVSTKFLLKYWRIVALILLPYNVSSGVEEAPPSPTPTPSALTPTLKLGIG